MRPYVMATLLLALSICGMVGVNAKREQGSISRGVASGVFAGCGILAIVILVILAVDQLYL